MLENHPPRESKRRTWLCAERQAEAIILRILQAVGVDGS